MRSWMINGPCSIYNGGLVKSPLKLNIHSMKLCETMMVKVALDLLKQNVHSRNFHENNIIFLHTS